MRWFSAPNKEWQLIALFPRILTVHIILCQPGDYEPLITLLCDISAHLSSGSSDIKDNLFPKSQSVWDVKTVNLLIHHPPHVWQQREEGDLRLSQLLSSQRRKLQNVQVRVVMTTLRRDWIVKWRLTPTRALSATSVNISMLCVSTAS